MATTCDIEECDKVGKHREFYIWNDLYPSDLCDKHYKQFRKEMRKAIDNILNRYEFNTILIRDI